MWNRLHLYHVSTRLDHSVYDAIMSIVHSSTEKCNKKREKPRNYLAQIAERDAEPHSSATPSSSQGLQILGRGAAISAATEELNLGMALAVGAPTPHSTSSESPTLGFWETWPLGEVGAASLCAEAVEDAVSERARDPAVTGTCSRGWGSAGGGSAIGTRLRLSCVCAWNWSDGMGECACVSCVFLFFFFLFFFLNRGYDWNFEINIHENGVSVTAD